MAVFFMLLVVRFVGVNSENGCEQPAPLPGTDAVWTSKGIQYKCRYNYIHTGGNLWRNCTNGMYDGNPPICEVDCGPVPEIENADYSTMGNPMSSIVYSCVNSTMIGSNPLVVCSKIFERWSNSDITCIKNEILSINVTQAMSDGDVNTCYTSPNMTAPYLSIPFDDWFEFHQVTIVTQNVTHPDFTITAKAERIGNTHWRKCLPASITLPANSRTVFNCKRGSLVRPIGDTLLFKTRYASEGQLQICELNVTGTKHIGDCGKPSLKPGQTIVKPISTSPKSLTGIEVSCEDPWYPVSGNGHALCNIAFTWNSPSLVCSREDWIFDMTVAVNYRSIIDQNYSSCFTTSTFPITVDLGRVHEIKGLIITTGASGMNWLSVSSENKPCSRLNGLESESTHTVNCILGPVGRYLHITVANPMPTEICEIKVQGRVFDDTLECYQHSKGMDYKGFRNLTISGKPCMKWESIDVYNRSNIFPDISVTNASNYCRNPLTMQRASPWCFTDINNWEYCTVFQCDESCALSVHGIEYNGNISQSAMGNKCLNWKKTRGFKHMFNYHTKEDENFCRNKLKEDRYPWCVTGPYTFETCNVPRCPTSSVLSFINASRPMVEETLNIFVQCQLRTPNESFTFFDNCWEKIVNNCLSSQPQESLQVLVTWVNNSATLFNIVCDDEQKTVDILTTERMITDLETTTEKATTQSTVNNMDVTDIENITVATFPTNVTDPEYLTTELTDKYITTSSEMIREGMSITETTTVSTDTPNFSAATVNRCKICYCKTRGLFFSEDSLKYAIIQNLLLDKNNLSKTYRKKNSIPDYRPFALATGGVGVIVLVSVILILVINDILGLLH